MLKIEVIYATLEEQKLFLVRVEAPATIRQCIEASGVLRQYPEIDLETMKVGVFSQIKPLDEAVVNGDRIEIYRPLLADPKEVRRKRAANKS
jgi:putative ubiquitin-RnfH superfamily antitoxin RatB of RatAB toxin-antitoxin module